MAVSFLPFFSVLPEKYFPYLCLMKIYILILCFWSFQSCTTVKNAERRHDRIVSNFPNVHRSDTIETIKKVLVHLPAEMIEGKAIFEKCPEVGEVFEQNETLKNGIKINSKLTGNQNGSKTLETKVDIPEKEIEVDVAEKKAIIYEKEKISWFQNKAIIFFMLIFSFVAGAYLSKILINKNQNL